ncbi:hypothetical protein SteCoe_2971 [Stentor coeruleus]|uniref:non-specific serine/threonine protein kinase n=1 Tax=Stentor coeruleus TaxID=5963 RepID=A0A1R2CY71_9CILI|nr:hypothetical protein SteCoe_2971 [Stentor coeruleus]
MSTSGSESSVIYDDTKESAKDYRPGGYHPIEIGDMFLNRYLVVQKLGWGHFSTVWLCKDLNHGTYVAMKVQKSAPNYTEAALDEIDLLLKISQNTKEPLWVEAMKQYHSRDKKNLEKKESSFDHCYVVQLLNTFSHVGVNGTHVCLVFEMLGVNLLEIIKFYQYKGIPIHLCRSISKQVLIGLDYLHKICGIIHTDLKPENVLVQLTQAQLKELFIKGMIENRAPIEVVVKETITPICKEIDDEKQKKIDKKKRYRKRKQEQKKQQKQFLLEHPDSEAQLPTKPKKKKRKNKKNLENPENPPELNPDELSNPQVIDPNLQIKIADLGNACWVNHHYSTEIQTRQYRSPEVILGINYNHTADIWSFACMLFELLTGDFLFDPRSNEAFDKDEDHLAQMIETLGIMPQSWALSGQYAKKFLNRRGELKNIKQLKIWLLKDVLIEKYRFKLSEAELLNNFLLPMLEFRPEKRITADLCLEHPWLVSGSVDYKMSEEDYQNYINEAEMKRLEAIDRLEKENYENFLLRAQELQNTIGEEEPLPYEIQELMKNRSYASTPDVPGELSAEECDVEDNCSSSSWFEDEEQKESLMIHEEDYHRHFRVD